MKKQTAHIEQWSIVYAACGARYMMGQISQHPNQSYFKAPIQQTSRVVRLDVQGRQCETENTIYTLGTHLDGDTYFNVTDERYGDT